VEGRCDDSRIILFTSESVSEAHPDKVCDQISGPVLDAFIATTSKTGQPMTATPIPGWVARRSPPPTDRGRRRRPRLGALHEKFGKHTIVNREAITEIARAVVRDIGYDQDGFSFTRRRRGPLTANRRTSPWASTPKKKGGIGRAGRRRRPGPDVWLRLSRQRGIREGL